MAIWNRESAAEIGPNGQQGAKLLAAAKTGDIAKTRSVLVEIGQSPRLAALIVTAVRCYGECEQRVKLAEGCRATKIAADQLLAVLRRTNPGSLNEAEIIAAKQTQCEREASAAHQKLEAARIAELEIGGLQQAFGWLFGKPCGMIFNPLPAAVLIECRRLDIGEGHYPWFVPDDATIEQKVKERKRVSAADAMGAADVSLS